MMYVQDREVGYACPRGPAAVKVRKLLHATGLIREGAVYPRSLSQKTSLHTHVVTVYGIDVE